jgi:DNA-binding transcriptional LysR family regulator
LLPIRRSRPSTQGEHQAKRNVDKFLARDAADFFFGSAIPRFFAQYSEISLDLSFSDGLTDIVAERLDHGLRSRVEDPTSAELGAKPEP